MAEGDEPPKDNPFAVTTPEQKPAFDMEAIARGEDPMPVAAAAPVEGSKPRRPRPVEGPAWAGTLPPAGRDRAAIEAERNAAAGGVMVVGSASPAAEAPVYQAPPSSPPLAIAPREPSTVAPLAAPPPAHVEPVDFEATAIDREAYAEPIRLPDLPADSAAKARSERPLPPAPSGGAAQDSLLKIALVIVGLLILFLVLALVVGVVAELGSGLPEGAPPPPPAEVNSAGPPSHQVGFASGPIESTAIRWSAPVHAIVVSTHR